MAEFLKKNWFHFLVWTTMFVYLSVAPALYAQLVLKNGKPIQGYRELPVDSNQIRFAVDLLDHVAIDREEVYTLTGWAFSTLDQNMPPDKYEREIVLISDSRTYFFPISQVIQRPDIQSAFSNLGMDLTYSGFNVLIAKEAIKPGRYRVGIVFRNLSNGSAQYYDKPARYMIRTPNNLFLK